MSLNTFYSLTVCGLDLEEIQLKDKFVQFSADFQSLFITITEQSKGLGTLSQICVLSHALRQRFLPTKVLSQAARRREPDELAAC